MIQIIAVIFVVDSVAMNFAAAFLSDTPRRPLNVAAFNIKQFGTKKISNIPVVNNIRKIVQRYDVVLLQEVQDSGNTVLKALQTHLNASDSWAFVASTRLGRTTYKEKYAFFYRAKLVQLASQFLYDDSVHDYFEREPFSVEFRYFSITKSAFRYVVFLGLHTSPNVAFKELGHLPTVMKTVASHFSNAGGVIGMGDFNAECGYVSNAQLRCLEIFRPACGFSSYINDSADTTVGITSCAYDRVISLGNIDVRNAQPYNFEVELGLSKNDTVAVSNHYPVEFVLY